LASNIIKTGDIYSMLEASLIRKNTLYKIGQEDGFKLGQEDGFKLGQEDGVEKGKLSIINQMISSGLSIEEIAKFTGIPLKKLQELINS
jgi:predicted transposase/invertase (TIGR01784 family)